MKIWIRLLSFAILTVTTFSKSCPSEFFSAVFTATIEQTVDDPNLLLDDPDLNFFKEYMKFKDGEIEYYVNKAIKFFNDSYGLDFSESVPNEKKERFFDNAKMSPFLFPSHINFVVTDNRWIRTGNTYSACYPMYNGGFIVSFSGNQTLYGSYGGDKGKPAGPLRNLVFGFYKINVCKQSPVIIQYRSSTPSLTDPMDGITSFNLDTYNRVLGHGKAQGIFRFYPDDNEPGQFHVVARNVFTFPAL